MEITDEYTGLMFDIGTPEGAVDAQLEVNKLLKSLEKTKAKIREVLEQHDKFEYKNHMIRVSAVQRMTYDPAILRSEIKDEDLLWQMFTPNKSWIDKYLADNLEDLGETSTVLRKSMVASGKPYTMVRLEKLTRED